MDSLGILSKFLHNLLEFPSEIPRTYSNNFYEDPLGFPPEFLRDLLFRLFRRLSWFFSNAHVGVLDECNSEWIKQFRWPVFKPNRDIKTPFQFYICRCGQNYGTATRLQNFGFIDLVTRKITAYFDCPFWQSVSSFVPRVNWRADRILFVTS